MPRTYAATRVGTACGSGWFYAAYRQYGKPHGRKHELPSCPRRGGRVFEDGVVGVGSVPHTTTHRGSHGKSRISRIPRIPGITVLNPVPRNVRIPMREPCRYPIFTLRLFETFLSKIACGTMWQSFLKNAGTACGKPANLPFYKELFVPRTLGTSLGQVGTRSGRTGG